jgi:translation initiation factor 6
MPLFKRLDFNGNPHLGVFARTNDELTFVAPQLTKRDYDELAEALETKVVEVTIGGSRLVGSLVAMNKRAALVSSLADPADLKVFKDHGLEVALLDDRLNAAGNNILVNDRSALVHPSLGPGTLDAIASLFDVEAKAGTIAGVPTVGMAAVVTSRGLLVHPRAGESEVNDLASFFGVEAQIGTVNHGAPYIGAGLVANRNGAVCGTSTTGIEIGRIEDALHLY